ncbi:hypothetical protein TNCV_131601 [Trichonephila clavipes]|nr:hypothetical protein TNCV_131601 [Trichonephila clavipes]
MQKSRTFMCHKRFREGQKSVNDDDRSGHPSTSQMDDSMQKVRHFGQGPAIKCLQSCADTQQIHNVLKEDLQMRRTCATI